MWLVLLEDRLQASGLKHGWDGDYAFMAWAHDADARQDSIFIGNILSVASIIADHGNSPDNLCRELQQAYALHLQRHFQSVNVSVTSAPIEGKDDSVYMLITAVRVTDKGVTADFRRGLEVTGNSMINVFNEVNI